MMKAGLATEPYMECQAPEQAVAQVCAVLHRSEPLTALFAGNNLMTRYLLHTLNALHAEVPGQVAIAGFDDLDVTEVLQPTLTVVRQPVHKIGEKAANLLFQRILQREYPAMGRRLVLPLELVVRGSCGCGSNGAAQQARQQVEVQASLARRAARLH
jgi:LacI family transcriptional regulator